VKLPDILQLFDIFSPDWNMFWHLKITGEDLTPELINALAVLVSARCVQ